MSDLQETQMTGEFSPYCGSRIDNTSQFLLAIHHGARTCDARRLNLSQVTIDGLASVGVLLAILVFALHDTLHLSLNRRNHPRENFEP